MENEITVQNSPGKWDMSCGIKKGSVSVKAHWLAVGWTEWMCGGGRKSRKRT